MAVEESIAEKLEDAEEPEKIDSRDIEADYVPRPIDEAIGLEMDGEAVLIVEEKFSTHWLNQTSTLVWNALDGVLSIQQLADEIGQQFGADPKTVLKDVLEVVRQFGMAGLLIGVSESVAGGNPRGIPQGIRPVFVALGTPEANRELLEEAGLDALLLLQDPGDAEIFYGMGTPAAYLVDEEGKTVARIAYGAEEVPALAKKAIGFSEQDESEFRVDFVRRL